MNILVVCQHYWPEPFNVNETCEMLVACGHRVRIVTGLPNCPQGYVYCDYKRRNNRIEERNGVEIRRAWLVPRGKNLSGINKLMRVANYFSFVFSASSKKLVRDFDFDVVLCIQYSPVLMAWPALRHASRASKPCVIYSFDLWPEDLLTGGMSRNGVPYKVMKRVSKSIYSSATMVAVTSPDFNKYFQEELGIKEIDSPYLPQYAEAQFENLAQMRPMKKDQGERKVTRFLFAGNIAGNQAVDNIVRSASLVKNREDIEIHLVGSGSKLDECIELSFQLGADNVIFHGRKPFEEMPEYYAMADAMLLPLSKATNGSLVSSYTIPRKLQSYLAAGKPVITAADGVASRIAEEGNFGLCCPAEDDEKLAESMIRFAALSDEERAKMGENAHRYYLEHFAQSMFIEKLEDILKRATNG